MGLASSLISLGDGTLHASFEGLKSHLDIAWIKSTLSKSGVATVRKRKLPVEQVVWLVVGMALYRDRPISDRGKGLAREGQEIRAISIQFSDAGIPCAIVQNVR
jgi:hypothetical protein